MGYYEIIVESHIDRKRSKDFGGLDYELLQEGKTLFFGILKDQAELYSILIKIRDMNLTLVSVVKDKKREEQIG